LPQAQRLQAYRRIREMLARSIRMNLLLPTRLAMVPQRK
jgi:hypothetical protein